MIEPSFKHNYNPLYNQTTKVKIAQSLKPMYRTIWNWEKCQDKIVTLRGRLGFPDSSVLKFLRLNLSLEDGAVYDELRGKAFAEIEATVYCILCGYANTKEVEETHQFVSFAQLPGGRSYQNAFNRRAVQPIERVFGSIPHTLCKAAELLDAIKLDYGDYSVKIFALPLVPIHIVLRSAPPEFPLSASILFNSSVSNYLSTEQIAMLSELTSSRLRHAYEAIT